MPASLDSLVPEFFEKVPIDPMDGKPLRYRVSEKTGCVLWSVGKDRIDDGGKVGRPDQQRVKGPDWVVELPPLKRAQEVER
jgi:hypothetical protein